METLAQPQPIQSAEGIQPVQSNTPEPVTASQSNQQ